MNNDYNANANAGDNNVPKYVAVYRWLDKLIREDKIGIGDKLPAEEKIARDFGINRMTVRQAIDKLVKRKMISRKRGKGTFLLRKTPLEYIWKLNNISSFTDSMESGGVYAYSTNDRIEVTGADSRTAELLGLESDLRVIYTLRTKYADNEPVCIEKSFLPYERFKELTDVEISGSLYHILVDKFNVYLEKSTQTMSSKITDQDEMHRFNITKPLPCLIVESVSFDPDNTPVEVLYTCFRGDRYKFMIESGQYQYQKKEDKA